MKKASYLLLGMLFAVASLPAQVQIRADIQLLPASHETTMEPAFSTIPVRSGDPIGTMARGNVTSIKIGEASNAFSTLASECNPVSVCFDMDSVPALAFIYRNNIATCGGQNPFDNGRLRYSISTDGGYSWSVGGGIVMDSSTTSPVNHCYGQILLTPNYDIPARYPMCVLFQGSGTTNIEDLRLSFSGSLINSGQWDGNVVGTVSDPANNLPTLEHEEYLWQSVGHTISGGMVERIPGEFWYVTDESQGTNNTSGAGRLFVYKGTYDSTTNMTNWVQATVIEPDNFLGTGEAVLLTPNMGFSPDGMDGYITFLGDMVGGSDTVLNPIVVETHDGGQTWSDAQEIDLNRFPEVSDSLQSILFLDSIGPGQFDTVALATGLGTTGFDHDMVVDANGNPHILLTVGAASTITAANDDYVIFSGIFLMNLNITKDAFGDWNAMYISTQNTFRGVFGDLSDPNLAINQDVHTQVSRSVDGNKIFFFWTDTDTSGGWTPLPSTPGGNNMTNYSPELLGRAYDLTTNKLTDVTNFTVGDPNWGTRILFPKSSTEAIDQGGNQYQIPMVIANLDGGSALQPTSYYYLTDIEQDMNQALLDPIFFYNCKENPFTNTIVETAPACNGNDGQLAVVSGGGLGELSYQWDLSAGNSTDSLVTGLTSGIYTVFITDEKACVDTIEVVLESAGAPVASLDGVPTDISCFGANDGGACVTVSGGTPGYTYTWESGESGACATALMPGFQWLEIQDSLGCSNFLSFEIDEPAAIIISNDELMDVSCYGDTDGSLGVSAIGGTGDLSFSWNTNDTGPAINNLSGGLYTVYVMDQNGCVDSLSMVVSEPDSIGLNFSSTPTDPGATTGTASASIAGGTPPYDIVWTNQNGDTVGTQTFIFNLGGGTYTLSGTDANGCPFEGSVNVSTVGIEDWPELGLESFLIYPQPADESLQIQIQLVQNTDLKLALFNLHGQIIWQKEWQNQIMLDEQIQVNSLATGMYMLRLSTKKGSTSQPVLIH